MTSTLTPRYAPLAILIISVVWSACGATHPPEGVADVPKEFSSPTDVADSRAVADLVHNDESKPEADILRPEGWAEVTHSNQVEADYEAVFPQQAVQTLALEFDPDDWQAIWDDMTEIYGEFGEGGIDPPQEMPQEAVDACLDLIEGEACSFELDGKQTVGTCETVWGGGVVGCVPEGQQNTNPMAQACVGKQSGDVCSANMGPVSFQGLCLPNNGLVCVPAEAIEACESIEDGEECTMQSPMGPIVGQCVLHGTTMACVVAMGPPARRAPGADLPPLPQGRLPARDAGGPPIEFGRNPIWIPCTVHFQGHDWTRVGFRFKGNSTLKMTWSEGTLKLPFKLDFDELEELYPEINDQRFYGFQKLSFANNARDNSYLREKVAGDLFREFGVLTPKRAHVRVTLDFGEGPTDMGIYTMAEVPDRPLFRSYFGKAGGNLYKPEGDPATFQAGLAIDETSFSKESNQDSSDWSDVVAAVASLHADRTAAEAWRKGLEARFDVQTFLKWLAANTVMQDWDTYGNATHNFYIYGNPAEEGRFYWIPWDHNESLKNSGGMISPLPLDMASITDRWPLIRLLMDDPAYQALYWQEVQSFVQGVFAENTVKARMQAEHDLIAPYFEDPNLTSPFDAHAVDATTFASSLNGLILHVQKRHEAVLKALNP